MVDDSAAVAPAAPAAPAWPHWQRMAFRFCAIYFTLQIAPWNWLARVPGLLSAGGAAVSLVVGVESVGGAPAG